MRFLPSILLLVVTFPRAALPDQGPNYLMGPPVFLTDEHDIPLTTFAASSPPAGRWMFCSSAHSPRSDGFVQNGADVQPALRLLRYGMAFGVSRGLSRQAAVGVLVPVSWTNVGNGIGDPALPASGDAYGLGGVTVFGKKSLWTGTNGGVVAGTIGIELSTGKDDATFDQSNAVTNAYYTGYPRRMPLAWQPSNGATNFCFVLSHGRAMRRVSYQGLLAYKLNGAGDEDVRLGNVIVAGASATYGLSERAATSVELVLRSQGDDSYPNAPAPGVNQPAIAGTTTHGTSLFLNPSIRYTLTKRITVGVGLKWAVVKPHDGMVPRSALFLILYPNL